MGQDILKNIQNIVPNQLYQMKTEIEQLFEQIRDVGTQMEFIVKMVKEVKLWQGINFFKLQTETILFLNTRRS